MDTSSYLARLESLLGGLPTSERQYAIAYYTEYLMDAGPQGVEAAIAALGTPESLAAQIRADVAMRGLDGAQVDLSSEFGWPGGVSAGAGAAADAGAAAGAAGAAAGAASAAAGAASNAGSPGVPAGEGTAANAGSPASMGSPATCSQDGWQPAGTYTTANSYTTAATGSAAGYASAAGGSTPSTAYAQPIPPTPESKSDSVIKTILIVLAAIFALPIGIPVSCAVLGLAIAVVGTVGSLILAVIAIGISLLATGIICMIAGFIALVVNWPTGLFYIGAGLIVLAVAVLFNWCMLHLMRLVFKGIALLFNSIRRKLSRTPDIMQQEASHV